MADKASFMFNKTATEKLRSPDDLDKYVRVTNPSVWAVLVACVALLMGLLIWGFLGSVTSNVITTGTVVNGKAVCFLSAEDTAKVSEGNIAAVGGDRMTVAAVTTVPVSREEAKQVLTSDYLVSALVKDDWAYQVTFEGDVSELTPSVPLSVNIITERIAPISLVFGDVK